MKNIIILEGVSVLTLMVNCLYSLGLFILLSMNYQQPFFVAVSISLLPIWSMVITHNDISHYFLIKSIKGQIDILRKNLDLIKRAAGSADN